MGKISRIHVDFVYNHVSPTDNPTDLIQRYNYGKTNIGRVVVFWSRLVD